MLNDDEYVRIPNFDSGLELFLRGMKPAMLLCDEVSFERDYINVLRGRYIEHAFKGIGGSSLVFFFVDEDVYADFEYRLGMYERGELDYHELLGYTLGYPPCVVRKFVEGDFEESDRVGVHFYGMQFMGYVDVLREAIDWLYDEYDVIGLEGDLYVNFHDESRIGV